MAGFLKGKFQIVWPLDFNMVGCKMGCLQLIMAVSIHIGYLGNNTFFIQTYDVLRKIL